jgi:hypothetical protein
MKRKPVTALLLLACLLTLAASGCKGAGVKIDLKQASYAPGFDTAGLAAYQGKSVFISDIANNAPNTSIWNYYSTTSTVYYEAMPTLHGYIWDCFVKAFERIGVKVAADAANAPDLSLAFTSISAQEMVFDVVLSRTGEAPFRKQYKVAAPPARGVDPAALENRGYGQVDEAFFSIVSDPDFRRAFLGR